MTVLETTAGGVNYSLMCSRHSQLELISYNDFAALIVISNSLALKRVDFKKKASLYFSSFPVVSLD